MNINRFVCLMLIPPVLLLSQYAPPGGSTKSSIGLGNVDNTSDANKPISTATQTALDAKLGLHAKADTAGNADTVTSGVYTSGSGTVFSAPPSITISTSGPVTVSAQGFYFNNASGALTYNLAAATAGARYCFTNSVTRTGAITLQLPASTFLAAAGANGSAAGTFVSSGALGDSVCVIGVDTTHYQSYIGSGTWTNN